MPNISNLIKKISEKISNIASEIDTKLSGKANSSHTHDDRYYTESEIDTKLSGKSDTTHNHNSTYLGITAKAESAKSADSVAWNNVSGKPSTYTPSSHTHDDRYYTESEIDTKLGGKYNTSELGLSTFKVTRGASISTSTTGFWSAMCHSSQTGSPTLPTSGKWWHVISMDWSNDAKNWVSQLAIATQETEGVYWRRNNAGGTDISSSTWYRLIDSTNIGSQSVNYANSAGSVAWSNVSSRPTKVSQFTNDSGYITGITKAMVTNALGYTPPTQDTNTWIALKGSTTSAAGTAGYAPAPGKGAANRYLRCDGTWQVPPDNNTTYSVATTSANGLMSSSDKTKLNKCITTDSIWIG